MGLSPSSGRTSRATSEADMVQLSMRLGSMARETKYVQKRNVHCLIYGVALVLVTGVSVASWFYLKAHKEHPLRLLLSSLDSLAYAFVLDLPFLTVDINGWNIRVFVAFFYTWSMQRRAWVA